MLCYSIKYNIFEVLSTGINNNKIDVWLSKHFPTSKLSQNCFQCLSLGSLRKSYVYQIHWLYLHSSLEFLKRSYFDYEVMLACIYRNQHLSYTWTFSICSYICTKSTRLQKCYIYNISRFVYMYLSFILYCLFEEYLSGFCFCFFQFPTYCE